MLGALRAEGLLLNVSTTVYLDDLSSPSDRALPGRMDSLGAVFCPDPSRLGQKHSPTYVDEDMKGDHVASVNPGDSHLSVGYFQKGTSHLCTQFA